MSAQHKIQPVTQRFKLNESIVNKLKERTPNFGFNGLGELVFRRTYSRNNEDWSDVVIRVVQGCMSIRKEHFYRSSLLWDDDKWQTFASDMALSLFDMEWLPPGRGLWMMGTDFTYERGSMSLNNCFQVQTKFWTSEGLKSFSDFKDGDIVVVRGKNKWVHATVKCFGKAPLWKLTVGKSGIQNTIFVTANHRWITRKLGTSVEEIQTTEELIPGYDFVSFEKGNSEYDTQLSLVGNSSWRVLDVEPTERVEDVWCVVEPEFEEFTLENGILTKNCSATDSAEDFVHSAEWTMDGLMNGVGVGFTTNWRGEATMPDKKDSEIFVIPDSREGWVESLIKLMCSYIDSPRYGKNKFPIFDYSQIRAHGEPIKGFGGTASGFDPLKQMHDRIESYLDAFCIGRLQCTSKTWKEFKSEDVENSTSEWREVEVEVDKPYSHTRLVADVFNAIGACVVAGNVRRCLPGDALVHTKGGLIPIKDVEIGQEALTFNGYQKITNKFVQGVQKLVKIITQDGDFRCTPNHRVAIATSYSDYTWKMASELVKGDRLIGARDFIEGQETSMPEWSYEKPTCKDIIIPELDSDMAWFVGFFYADGYTCPNYDKNGINAYVSLIFGLDEMDIAERAKEQLERFGENHVTLKKQKDKNNIMVHCQSKQLAWYFDKNFKQANTEIRVPEFILKARHYIKLAYVAGVMDGHGCTNTRPIIVVSTVYENFARDLQNILYSCGIESKLNICTTQHRNRNDNWQKVHKLTLITERSRRKFSGIPELFTSSNKAPSISQNANGFPNSFETNPKVKTLYGLYGNKEFNIDAYATQYGECSFTPIEVVEVVEDVEEETYDIEVENRHEFFCNGYLSHNSAEISLGYVDDKDFMNLKNYEINPERSAIGWLSNNSVVLRADNGYKDFSYIPELARRILDNGEPGMINLYNIQKYGRSGKELPDEATMVNPCFSGDTLIGVADGRNCVSIKQLSEEGKDVPVYSINKETMEVSIKWGRNPRVTGHNQKLLRIHFGKPHKGEFVDVTPNHKCFTNDGRIVEAKDLKKNDSLPMFRKGKNGKNDYIVVHSKGKRLVEHRMIKEFYETKNFYENFKEGYSGCCKTNGVVVHHKDENKQNNNPDNLEITTPGEHASHHNEQYRGVGNPMYGRQHSQETKELIGSKAVERCSNPEYRKMLSDAQTPEMREKSAITMTQLKRKLDIEHSNSLEILCQESGLKTVRFSETDVKIIRNCENCQEEFYVVWSKRERSYCSTSCGNTKAQSIESRKRGQKITFEEKARINFHEQAMIYKDLCENKENVSKIDWETACKAKNISYRFNRKSDNPYIAKGWKEFKEMVDGYNHQISEIEELEGDHTVYNITVDDNHTVAVVTKANDAKALWSGVLLPNCGEIPLENFELCNLAEVFPPRCSDPQKFYKALEYATLYASTVSLLPTHRPETNAVIAKNRRIGVSISGIAQWANRSDSEEWGQMNYTKMISFLRKGYKVVRETNTRLAKEAGVPAAVRVTTVKPSGSISLLAGATPGVHSPVSRYAIRRVRIGMTSPLVPSLIAAGVPHEKDIVSENTYVFEFVIDHGDVRPCEEVSPWEQFSVVQMMQKHYADNCVSATIYFDKEKDGPDVEKMLAMFIPNLKSVSMLPHSGHGYAQPPYEPITFEQYEKRKNEFKHIDYKSVRDNVPAGSKFCSGDTCEL
jgi:intein/homing endonuclease